MSVIYQEAKTTLKLAWPLMGSQFLQISMVFVDNLMVGHLGTLPLAAMALATTLSTFVFIFSIGVIGALNPMIAHSIDENASHPDEARTIRLASMLRQGFFCALGLSLLAVLIFLNGTAIFRLFGQEERLLPQAQSFLTIFCCGIFGHLLFACLRQLSEANGFTRPSLIITLLGALLNALLDYLLIFGKCGFPAMGLGGAALATSLVGWMMLVAMFFYMRQARYFSPVIKALSRWGDFKIEWKTFAEILKIGAPMGGMWICEVSFFSGSALMMGHFGTLYLAAHQIALNVASIIFIHETDAPSRDSIFLPGLEGLLHPNIETGIRPNHLRTVRRKSINKPVSSLLGVHGGNRLLAHLIGRSRGELES
jgi:MATE family multidrug resistance protein